MIGSIRKHSKWLWIVIAGLTIISFVVFMGSGPVRNGGAGGSGSLGTIYGTPVTPLEYQEAYGAMNIYYWLRTGQWPDKGGLSKDDQEREIYSHIMVMKKAAKLGVQISDATLAAAAADFLQQFGRGGQPPRIEEFVQQYLLPEHLGVDDLKNFLRYELMTRQLAQTLGLAGALVTPQEAGMVYDRSHQEVSAEAVFFNASNYLPQVTAGPAAIGEFYSNNLAAYRIPDRVSVSYVFFPLSNYVAMVEQQMGKTNIDAQVENLFKQHGGMQAVPGAKTPEEAKAKIREFILNNEAVKGVRQAANDFAGVLFAMTPATPENLATVAKQKNVTVHTTAPFTAQYGPTEFMASAEFVRQAFNLSQEVPFAGPIAGSDGIYILALGSRLPSSIPALSEIQSRVVQDYQEQQAVVLARTAGVEFQKTVAAKMTSGSSFNVAAVSAGHAPVTLTNFSLSTPEVADFTGRNALDQLKQAAFTTPAGQMSSFIPESEGGYVLYVKALLPVDQAQKKADLPLFQAQYQRERQGEAFQLWLAAEANRELRDTPYFEKMTARGAAK